MSSIAQSNVPAHFRDDQHVDAASRLGMWLFLAGTLVLFGGLAVIAAVVRASHPEMWAAASDKLNLMTGTLSTLVLIVAAAAAAIAVRTAKVNVAGEKNTPIAGLLIVAVGLLGAFVALIVLDHGQKTEAGMLPGALYAYKGLAVANAQLFFAVFIVVTTVHGLFVAAGAAMLLLMAIKAKGGAFHAGRHGALENAANFVQVSAIAWFFLFPLLYLV